ncbi:response regulator transcription factor [Flavobacteriaceae bacterium XHP0103]|uniref:LytR/AlgR family response regulator transcription factor n=1 Tax=Marixanthotalea marina TaxID=2844359 RepID=UPI002989C4E1|nr:response regulator transcription factor [Marixanthotalea marina]MBU3820794.1 response regulator transcription factor [Marixanthotalea marina]
MITAIAIDDEPKAIQVIQHHADKLKNINLLSSFTDAQEALKYLKENPVDLVFLDINMPHLSGLELLDNLHLKPQVIFTTAYSEFAVESYNYNAVDYLLKPFEFDRFQQAIHKVEQRLELQKQTHSYCFIKDGFKNIKIAFEEILFIKGSGNYLDIVTKAKTLTTRMTFLEMVEKLPASKFVRVHQSYLVNVEHIDKIENNQVYIASEKIPISGRYRDVLYRRLDLA